MMDAYKDKSDNLAEKMNKLTAKFQENLDNAEELELSGDDVIEYVQEKTSLYKENGDGKNIGLIAEQIVNLDIMVADFRYVRETLKENIENGRRVMNSITIDLLDADEESRATLVMAFAQLNSAIASNSKIYLASYKQISDIIINLDKVMKKEKDIRTAENDDPNKVENHLHIHGQAMSTVELIKQLKEEL